MGVDVVSFKKIVKREIHRKLKYLRQVLLLNHSMPRMHFFTCYGILWTRELCSISDGLIGLVYHFNPYGCFFNICGHIKFMVAKLYRRICRFYFLIQLNKVICIFMWRIKWLGYFCWFAFYAILEFYMQFLLVCLLCNFRVLYAILEFSDACWWSLHTTSIYFDALICQKSIFILISC